MNDEEYLKHLWESNPFLNLERLHTYFHVVRSLFSPDSVPYILHTIIKNDGGKKVDFDNFYLFCPNYFVFSEFPEVAESDTRESYKKWEKQKTEVLLYKAINGFVFERDCIGYAREASLLIRTAAKDYYIEANSSLNATQLAKIHNYLLK